MHLQENQKADLTIRVKDKLYGFVEYSALGYSAGQAFPDSVISFDFAGSKPNKDLLNGLSTGLETTSKASTYTIGRNSDEEIDWSFEEIGEAFREFNSELEPNLFFLGMPDPSIDQIKKVARLVKGKKIVENLTFWIHTTQVNKDDLDANGFEDILSKAGIELEVDESILDLPLKDEGYTCIWTNSTKAASNAKQQIEVKLSSIEEMVEYAFV